MTISRLLASLLHLHRRLNFKISNTIFASSGNPRLATSREYGLIKEKIV